MGITERIKAVRIAEGFSQEQLCKEVDWLVGSLRNWEQGRSKSIASDQLEKLTTHPRFQKYALWIVTGTTAPEAGQISPETEGERNTA